MVLGLWACAPKPSSAPKAGSPRLLQVPAAAAGFPARPPAEAAEKEACARAAFELPLDAAGRVLGGEPPRILAWEDDASDPYALVRLQVRARASRWQLPPTGETGESRQAAGSFGLLRLDCGVVASDRPIPGWGAFESRLQESLQVRLLAREHLRRATGVPWSEHDLDCLWIDLNTWRRGPFLHDAVEGWEDLEARLQVLQAHDGGLWVCRAPRSSHMGQFIFVDRERQVLAVARYWLGE